MGNTVIQVRDIGKQYQIGSGLQSYETLRENIIQTLKWPIRQVWKGNSNTTKAQKGDDFIWALKGINFEVEQGQLLGIIGRNGAGKSTLLKILSRITEPTEGYAEIQGRVGSLLEVGTGFHPELTGRENIYLNGAILGMNRSEIDEKFDEIVEFSGVEKFIETPVKRYSSGMYLRLAFSVAAHLEPEILLVDEVLAVGDAEFQRKCLGKMSDVAREGRTVLFVSHDMSAISSLTEETIVLDQGKIVHQSRTDEAIDFYMSQGFSEEGERKWPEYEPANDSPFSPVSLRVLDENGQIIETFMSPDPITVEFEYQLEKSVKGLRVGIYLRDMMGVYIFTSFDTDNRKQYEQYEERSAGRYVSRTRIPADLLNEGRYVLGVNASVYRVKRHFQDLRALAIDVSGIDAPGKQWPERRRGVIRPRLEWEIEKV